MMRKLKEEDLTVHEVEDLSRDNRPRILKCKEESELQFIAGTVKLKTKRESKIRSVRNKTPVEHEYDILLTLSEET